MRFVAQELSARMGGETLFRGVEMELERGETIAVQGPSGSGKTLLLRQLAWLDTPSSGQVWLDGQTPRDWGIPRWRTRVTFVAQNPPPLNGSALEFWDAARRFRGWRGALDAREIAESWGVPGDRWRQRFSELSGGERQRITLALALSGQPDVLLLDEPTSALDPDATCLVETRLREAASIWVTHDAAQAERVGTRTLDLGQYRLAA